MSLAQAEIAAIGDKIRQLKTSKAENAVISQEVRRVADRHCCVAQCTDSGTFSNLILFLADKLRMVIFNW